MLDTCIRYMGTKTYYDFDDLYPIGTAPDGYQNVLKKDLWINLLNFVAMLMVN